MFTVKYEKHTKYMNTNTPNVVNTESCNIKEGGAYSNHCTL